MKISLLGLLLFLSAACAPYEAKNFALIDSPTKKEIRNELHQVKGKRALYKDDYTGNFTYYYSPIIIDDTFVDVPIVTCTAYRIHEEELVRYEGKVRRCSYDTQRRFYSVKPEYFFNFEKASVSIQKAKEIAFAWYEKNASGKHYIKDIYKKGQGLYFISLSGGACAGMTESATEISAGRFEFKYLEDQVFICS